MPRTVTDLQVDFAKPLGAIRPLHGVNFGPRYGSIDLSDRFRAAGFPSIRLHDCPAVCRDTVDIHCVFPLFHLDETDPANWTFAPTDDYLAAIKGLGSDIIYRLGPTIEHQEPKYHVHPPADFDKWGRICCGIIRHYNEGWADGFRHHITHWEIWNEPWHRSMWTGLAEEWFRLYETASRAIRREFPDVKLGGADAQVGTADLQGPRGYAADFLRHCRRNDCPMDFFCWHLYARTPKDVVDSARNAKALCEEFGYDDAELNLNEWNWFPEEDWTWRRDTGRTRRFHDRLASAESGAFVASTLSLLQDEPMTMANWYAPFLGKWGMFDQFRRPQKPYYAFVAFNAMLETPQRVQASGGRVDTGLGLLAGRDPDGRRAQVLVSNFADHDVCDVRLVLDNLPPGRWRGTEHLLDDATDLRPVRTVVVDGLHAEITLSVPRSTVCLMAFERGANASVNSHRASGFSE